MNENPAAEAVADAIWHRLSLAAKLWWIDSMQPIPPEEDGVWDPPAHLSMDDPEEKPPTSVAQFLYEVGPSLGWEEDE